MCSFYLVAAIFISSKVSHTAQLSAGRTISTDGDISYTGFGLHPDVQLPCTGYGSFDIFQRDFFQWERLSSNSQGSVVVTATRSQNISGKYAAEPTYFSTGIVKYNLMINNANKSDEGMYECRIIRNGEADIAAQRYFRYAPVVQCNKRFSAYLDDDGRTRGTLVCAAYLYDWKQNSSFVWSFADAGPSGSSVSGTMVSQSIAPGSVPAYGSNGRYAITVAAEMSTTLGIQDMNSKKLYPAHSVTLKEVETTQASYSINTLAMLECNDAFLTTTSSNGTLSGSMTCAVLYYNWLETSQWRWSFIDQDESGNPSEATLETSLQSIGTKNGRDAVTDGDGVVTSTTLKIDDMASKATYPVYIVTLMEAGVPLVDSTVSAINNVPDVPFSLLANSMGWHLRATIAAPTLIAIAFWSSPHWMQY